MYSHEREFQVFVKPAGARCNLACQYCYYLEKERPDQPGGGGRMSDEMLERFIRQHIEAWTEPVIGFSWHGGEPSLAGLDFFRKAVAYQKKYKPQNKEIVNGIQTNATLLDEEWGSFMKEEGFVTGVSLDGPEEYHNLYRHTKNKKGTFHQVIKGVEMLRKHQVPVEILCVVHRGNVFQPLEVYRFFKELGAEFITFLPLAEHRAELPGRVSEESFPARAFGEFLTAVFEEWKENDIGQLKVQIFEEALRIAFGQDHTLCIFKKTCGGVPVVEKNGDFYTCDHYVNPEHLLGNLENRSLVSLLNDPRQTAFGKAKWTTLPAYCRECEVLDMCHGECPKNRFISSPEGEPGLNYLCEGYRRFFNHIRPFAEAVAEVWRTGRNR